MVRPRSSCLAMMLAIAACGGARMYDVDLQPLREPRVLMAVDGGWFALDSSARGVRALIELQIPIASGDSSFTRDLLPRLACGTDGAKLPERVRVDPIVCKDANMPCDPGR